jgi:hypothetical protein
MQACLSPLNEVKTTGESGVYLKGSKIRSFLATLSPAIRLAVFR